MQIHKSHPRGSDAVSCRGICAHQDFGNHQVTSQSLKQWGFKTLVLKHLGSPASTAPTSLYGLDCISLDPIFLVYNMRERAAWWACPGPFLLWHLWLWFRKYAEASKIKCNKAANHTLEEKAYYYLFFHITSWWNSPELVILLLHGILCQVQGQEHLILSWELHLCGQGAAGSSPTAQLPTGRIPLPYLPGF